MVSVPFSTYYATKFQAELWKPLDQQQDAFYWQDESADKKEDSAHHWKDLKQAADDDMDANPYRRYCRDHKLPLGSRIERINPQSLKYRTTLILTLAIEPLKHLAGTIEAIVRLPLSFGVSILSLTAKLFCLNRICPSKLNHFFSHIQNRILQSPIRNTSYIITNLALFIIKTMGLPFVYFGHKDNENINGFYKDFSKQVKEMDGTDIPLWKIYQETNEAQTDSI